MRIALNSVLGCVFTVAGLLTWRLFGDTHASVTIFVQDDREMRWQEPVWRDYLRYAGFHVPAVAGATFAYLFRAVGIWRIVRAIRRAASPVSSCSV